MASNSRAAQEQLSALEKANAPFEDQLHEAAKFVGVEICQLGVGLEHATNNSERSKEAVYHGREEWLLRWLLKKMQVPEDDVPRKHPTSWLLLNFLLHAIPLSNAARILSERQFLPILRRTLDEVGTTKLSAVDAISSSDSTVANTEAPRKSSKKRKRPGKLVELVATPSVQLGELPKLMDAIFVTMDYMVQSTKLAPEIFEEGRSAAFSAEYMKNVIRTTASQSAMMLGSWLSLCFTLEQNKSYPKFTDTNSWLLPFIEIWETRLADDDSQMQFSLFSTRPALSLLRAVKGGNNPNITWATQLEELIARNIMIPAKAAAVDNAESNLLGTLTRVSVLQDTSNAPLLFEIAIRSIQVHGSKRRKVNDDGWLQTVFTTLKDSMSDRTETQNGKQVCAMLQSAIDHKLKLDLSILRSITSKFALPDCREDWRLLATIIKLDANVFLIANGEKDLLQELLQRITKASATQSWPGVSEDVVSGVLVPLMREFAQARDLSGFIRHWFSQFVQFEELQKNAQSPVDHFSAWEDVTLQNELSELLEASLTNQQITQILDWLASQVTESPAAVCIILEAIASAVSREDVVDSVGLRLYHIMFDSEESENMNDRYKWRSWRVLSQTLCWSTAYNVDEVTRLWGEDAKPFGSLLHLSEPAGLLIGQPDEMAELNTLETFRFACAAWTAARKGSRMQELVKPIVLNFLQSLTQFVESFLGDIEADMKIGQEPSKPRKDASYRGNGCRVLSFARCIFIEYPMVLELGLSMKDGVFREMLQKFSWICSASLPDTSPSAAVNWLKKNHEAFSDLWIPLFHCDYILNNKKLMENIVEILLSSDIDTESSAVPIPITSTFTVKTLLQVPVGLVSKSSREKILRGSFPVRRNDSDENDGSLYKSTVLDPAGLSLKIKMMTRPVVYEGMEFQEFVNLADSLAASDIQRPQVNLALLKELVRLTINFVHTNPDQSRNSTYISDAFNLIQKRVDRAILKKKHQLNYALVAVFDVTITAFHSKANTLDDLGVIQGEKLENLTMSFQKCLVDQLGGLVTRELKLEESDTLEHIQWSRYLLLLSVIDALSALGVDSKLLAEIAESLKAFAATVVETELNVGQRLRIFLAKHGPKSTEQDAEMSLNGNVSDFYGRQLIQEGARARAIGLDNKQKLEYLSSIFGSSLTRPHNLDRLLSARTVISMIDDVGQSLEEKGTKDSTGSVPEEFDLTEAYSILCGQLWKASGVRQFCIIAETLQLMLRTKPRSISQFNVDMTLGAISIICSHNGPRLNELRAGTIYSHMCWLLQAVLTHHRTKLQGHFHLVVQVMQSLLRCLFTPLPHSSTRTDKTFGAPPPWLASRKHGLKDRHATAYTRLVLMICDPTVSAVRGAQQNNLTSAKDKAKRMAGIHMQYVLISYIKLQLEMKMLPEIREKMVPGLYAIFDTTTPESRRMVSDSLDSSGRAVFGTLYKDWQRFGKWGGS